MWDGMNMAFSADYFRNADYLVRVKALLLRAVGALPPHPQNVRCAPVSLRACAKETGAAVAALCCEANASQRMPTYGRHAAALRAARGQLVGWPRNSITNRLHQNATSSA